MCTLLRLLLLMAILIVTLHAEMQLTKLENCNGSSSVNINITNNYIKHGIFYITQSLGANPFDFKIDYSVNNKIYLTLTTIRGNNACKALNDYGGQVWYDLEKAAHIPQFGYCPIPKGVYHITDYTFKGNRMTFQTYPHGYVKSTLISYDQKRQTLLSCVVMHITNL